MRYSFGLGESSLDHRRREEFPAIFTIVVSFFKSLRIVPRIQDLFLSIYIRDLLSDVRMCFPDCL